MKRVLIFSLTYFPYVGGAEVAMKEITDRLDPAEYQFDMITLRFDSALPRVDRVGNVTVHRLGPSVSNAKVSDRALVWQLKLAKILFPVAAFIKAVQLNYARKYDMTWALMANQSAFAALFFKWTHPSTPYYLELQDGRAFADMKQRQPLLSLVWPLYKRVYLRADRIKAISQFIATEVRSLGYRKEIEVIPNAVDVAKFSAPVSAERILELQVRFGKKMGDIFLFTASRLVLSRGVEDTILALKYLPPHVKLLIAGSGEDQSKLEKIAHEANLTEQVIFAGYIDHDTLPALYKISDIFVRPSIIEGFGNAFVEAFAAGIPVVATPVGGIPDFLTDGETGLFCEVHSPESIAKAVEQYMSNPILVKHVTDNAKRLVAEKYDWSIIAASMRSRIFDSLVTRPHASRERTSLKIVLAASIFPPEIGGPATYAAGLKESFERMGHTVQLEVFSDLKKYPTGVRHAIYTYRLWRAARGADALIAFDVLTTGLPAALVGKLIHIPVIARIGGDFVWERHIERTGALIPLPEFYARPDAWSRRDRLLMRAIRFVVHSVDVAFSSEWQEALWRVPYALDERRTHVIENVLPAREVGETTVVQNFLHFGRQLKLKNASALKSAFARVQKTHPGISLEEGTLSQGELIARIKKGYAVVLPSISDVTPNYILDAIRCGKPFLLTKHSAYAEVFKDFGVIVDPQNVGDIARGLVRLLDPKEYARMSAAIARFTAVRTYDDIAKEFLAIIEPSEPRQ